jgi:hypothetical protein
MLTGASQQANKPLLRTWESTITYRLKIGRAIMHIGSNHEELQRVSDSYITPARLTMVVR